MLMVYLDQKQNMYAATILKRSLGRSSRCFLHETTRRDSSRVIGRNLWQHPNTSCRIPSFRNGSATSFKRQFGTETDEKGSSSQTNKEKTEATKSEPTATQDEDESHLNWKDRKEAPKWMRRIAPTKGGKWPPSPQEAAILSAGLALFVWSWTAG